MTRFVRNTAVAGALLIAAGAASADVILDTGMPGGFFGFIGYDIFESQSVAIAFTPTQAYTLDSVGLWIMSNDFDMPGRTLTVTLRTDDADGDPTIPGSTVIEKWDIATTAVGWDPVLESLTSALHPTLNAGQSYWVVAESTEPGGLDPVWVWGDSPDPHTVAILDGFGPAGWEGGVVQGSSPGTIVTATPVPGPAAIGVVGFAGLIGAARRRR